MMSYLPGVPAIGLPQVKIQIEACIASIFGLILGPYLGALATFVGVFAAWAFPPGSPSITGLIFLPSPVINAFTTGLICNGRWKEASIMLASLIFAFWILPPAQPIEQNFIIGVAAMWDKILALLLIPPTFSFMRRTVFMGLANEDIGREIKKYNWAAILSLLSAILILINAFMIAVNGDVLKFSFEFQNETYKISFGSKFFVKPMAPHGYLWLVLGIGILVSVIIFHIKPEYNIFCGGTIIALSGLSAIIGGGFIAGLILGVMGGFLIIIKKAQIFKASSMEALIYFLLAFIGNEADNAWGNTIFAVPAVYEGIFQTPLEFVRWAFLVSPYAYFIIRIIQAIIAALIAVPLINNLRSTRFGLPGMLTKKD
jgi:hypothetical protein